MVNKGIPGSGETNLENWISRVLIVGVVISLILEGAGMMLFYRLYRSTAIFSDSAMSIHGQDFFTFLVRLVFETQAVPFPLYLMTLGITVLILTPYVRTAMSVFYFASVKNIKYLIITLFVLTILTVSLATH
jgi:uncharacterized membrane protein